MHLTRSCQLAIAATGLVDDEQYKTVGHQMLHSKACLAQSLLVSGQQQQQTTMSWQMLLPITLTCHQKLWEFYIEQNSGLRCTC
jgi:hypothetical protein